MSHSHMLGLFNLRNIYKLLGNVDAYTLFNVGTVYVNDENIAL